MWTFSSYSNEVDMESMSRHGHVQQDGILIRSCDQEDLVHLTSFSRSIFIESSEATGVCKKDLVMHCASHHSLEYYRGWLENPRYSIMIALDETASSIIGYAVCGPWCENDARRENKSVELKRIYVSRAFQGRGIGGQLLRVTIASGQTEYPRAVFVRVYIDNSSAIAFYKRERFEYHDTASMLIGSRRYMVQVMKRQ